MTGGNPPAQPPPTDPRAAHRRRLHVLLWRWRRTPLRRPSDRLHAWITLALALAVLATAPAALFAAGDRAHRHYQSTAQHEALTRTQRPATLTHDAPRHPEPGSDEAKEARYPVPVRYTDPHGHTRTGKADVAPGLPAGRTVLVWTDTEGRLTRPPSSTEQIRNHTMGWALLAFLAVPLTGLAVHAATSRLIQRHNLAQWDAAWASTAPRWSTRP
ncbi:Rv1733c family protein [Streptomyces endophyticus]|uniref:Proline rich protein membrane protein n=1 Tax=Streptomyces endophyticus TaxID=714166 RepID=A0ABU6FDV9_9ACTN|nr:hypothetical protein [Streptomyces endophyticus]MEB8342108.1 hypothetical protein [Streptomyces endophyticus]